MKTLEMKKRHRPEVNYTLWLAITALMLFWMEFTRRSIGQGSSLLRGIDEDELLQSYIVGNTNDKDELGGSLDFAVIGFPKCGTWTILKNLNNI